MQNLTCHLGTRLKFCDPLMIASSHWTSNENAFKQLAPSAPDAVTLKTTSETRGGAGKSQGLGRGRDMRALRNVFGNSFATYTDGPTSLELWDLATTYEMTRVARQVLPTSTLGLSILQDEDYADVAEVLDLSQYGYVELNWKYTFRGVSLEALGPELDALHQDLCEFLCAFQSLPVIVKLPREAIKLIELNAFDKILATLVEHDAALIVANSRRTRVPPSRVPGRTPIELRDGVIVGEELFLETFHTLRLLSNREKDDKPVPQLIASGGIVDTGGIIDVIAAGANAVQLCTAMDLWGVHVIDWIREQLSTVCERFGSFADFSEAIRQSDEAWQKAVVHSREFELDQRRVVITTCRSSTARELLQQTLINECSIAPPVERFQEGVTAVSLPKDHAFRFIVMRGNASSFLLVRRCVSHLGLTPVELENVQTFVASLWKADFSYDFAVISEPALRYIQKDHEGILNGNMPQLVAAVAQSRMELVGDSETQLQDVSHVYHFGGTTSRRSVAELLKSAKPAEVEAISTRKLAPLLRAWKTGHAILAKPPLSLLYGAICRQQVRERWSSLWHTDHPLVLVASEKVMSEENGAEISDTIARQLEIERRKILGDPVEATEQLVLDGYLEYCASLLSKGMSGDLLWQSDPQA